MTVVGTGGIHILVECWGCDPETLDDRSRVHDLMTKAAGEAGATVVATVHHRFAPSGVSVVVVISESHLSIHTWPEYGYAAIDFYTCGDCSPDRAVPVLREGLAASTVEQLSIERGQLDGMRVSRSP